MIDPNLLVVSFALIRYRVLVLKSDKELLKVSSSNVLPPVPIHLLAS